MSASTENERREQAFLALIRYAESNKLERPDAYYRRNGGRHFANLHHHPGPKRKGEASSASGAYQITFETCEELIAKGGPRDFSERSQDALALQMLREKGVLPLIWDGQLQGAFLMLRRIWNSLPGGTYQLITEDEAETYFWQQLGEPRK